MKRTERASLKINSCLQFKFENKIRGVVCVSNLCQLGIFGNFLFSLMLLMFVSRFLSARGQPFHTPQSCESSTSPTKSRVWSRVPVELMGQSSGFYIQSI